jgi:hypothetical protein
MTPVVLAAEFALPQVGIDEVHQLEGAVPPA